MKKFVVEIFSGVNEDIVSKSVSTYINGLDDKVAGEAAANVKWMTCAINPSGSNALYNYITAVVSYWE